MVIERPSWNAWVTPKQVRTKPVHRWYVFPHSFTDSLVGQLIDDWSLAPNDLLLDPFCGAGTTLVTAQERGLASAGYDLSPFAVFASHTKVASYNERDLRGTWRTLAKALSASPPKRCAEYPQLVERALPGQLLDAFEAAIVAIRGLACPDEHRDFLLLAVMAILPRFSRAVASGGWLKWSDSSADPATLPDVLSSQIDGMLADLQGRNAGRPSARADVADARTLPDPDDTFSAVITSPPYPNRHDYTRVFGVELMLHFLDWEGTRKLRYQTFHSHPEARPHRGDASGYIVPIDLANAIDDLTEKKADPRVICMLKGYFLDMFLCLRELKRVTKASAPIALVVGNARYSGVDIMVDSLTAEVGIQAGLAAEDIVVARYRGNSAQQMGLYGRRPSRESIVVLRNA